MKKLFLLSIAFFGLSTISLQADNFYVSAFGGAQWIQDNLKHYNYTYELGYTYGASMGYKWGCSGWRAEAEFAYRKNRIKKFEGRNFSFDVCSHQRYYTGMGNILYDFCIPTSYVHPFVGVGAGWYQQKNNTFYYDRDEDGFGWQVLAGLSYEINGCYNLDLTYCMFKLKEEFYTHSARLGLSYNF